MNFLDLVKMRHSVRNYETRAVEKENMNVRKYPISKFDV